MAKTGVIGSGSWGTALARVLSKNGHEVTLWSGRENSGKYRLHNRPGGDSKRKRSSGAGNGFSVYP